MLMVLLAPKLLDPAVLPLHACSSPDDKYEVKQGPTGKAPSNTKPSASAKKAAASGNPDFGLSQTHEVVKLLGRGGEGETWLFKDKSTGGEIAIKLIKRPIPKPAIAVIKREIKIQSDLGQACDIGLIFLFLSRFFSVSLSLSQSQIQSQQYQRHASCRPALLSCQGQISQRHWPCSQAQCPHGAARPHHKDHSSHHKARHPSRQDQDSSLCAYP